jgi:hypothetical protein
MTSLYTVTTALIFNFFYLRIRVFGRIIPISRGTFPRTVFFVFATANSQTYCQDNKHQFFHIVGLKVQSVVKLLTLFQTNNTMKQVSI